MPKRTAAANPAASPETTRRTVLKAAGTLGALGALAVPTAVFSGADPVFAAIADHERCWAHEHHMYRQEEGVLRAFGRWSPQYEAFSAAQSEAANCEIRSLRALLSTVPASRAGFLAWLDHLGSEMVSGGLPEPEDDVPTILRTVRAFIAGGANV